MGTPHHKEALAKFTQTIFEQDISGYPDSAIMVDDEGYCDLSSSDVGDRLYNLCQYIEGDTIGALLLLSDPRCAERAEGIPLGHHGTTFPVELVGTEGEYIGCFREELEGLLGTTEISYGRLKGCFNLTFFFKDQNLTSLDVPVGQIPTIRGNIVVVHRDLDHLTIGIDPYSDAPSEGYFDDYINEEKDEGSISNEQSR